MKVSDVMTQMYVKVTKDEKLRKVNEMFQRYHVEYVLVASPEDRLEGIVTYHELFQKILPSYSEVMQDHSIWLDMETLEEKVMECITKPVKSIMVKNVHTVSPDTPLVKAGALMNAHHIRQLPVIGDGKIVGVLRFRDIMWGFLLKSSKYV